MYRKWIWWYSNFTKVEIMNCTCMLTAQSIQLLTWLVTTDMFWSCILIQSGISLGWVPSCATCVSAIQRKHKFGTLWHLIKWSVGGGTWPGAQQSLVQVEPSTCPSAWTCPLIQVISQTVILWWDNHVLIWHYYDRIQIHILMAWYIEIYIYCIYEY